MKIKLLDDIKLPVKSHLPDSGLDLFVPQSFVVAPLDTITIGLKLAISIPEGFAGMLVPRSSIAQTGLIIQTAIIDPDYNGEIHLIATNCSNNNITIEKNQRICSLVVYSVLNPYLEIVDNIESSYRQNKGLGSTGK